MPLLVRACAVLGIVDNLQRRSATADSSCGEFARFKSATGRTRCGELGAHLLDLRGLLSHGCSERLNFPLLLRNSCLEIFPLLRDCRFPLLIFAVLFEKLIEQHRVHRFITHGVDPAILITHDEIGIHLGYFLSNQAELRCICLIALVVESHWLKREHGFAGLIHWFDLLLKSPRRTHRAQLAVGVYNDTYGVGNSRCHTTNGSDKGSCLRFAPDTDGAGFAGKTKVANVDIVIAGGEIGPAKAPKAVLTCRLCC
jgi:hypothetical protein